VHMTDNEMDYVQTQRRNREWVAEVSAKLERVNALIKRKNEYATA